MKIQIVFSLLFSLLFSLRNLYISSQSIQERMLFSNLYRLVSSSDTDNTVLDEPNRFLKYSWIDWYFSTDISHYQLFKTHWCWFFFLANLHIQRQSTRFGHGCHWPDSLLLNSLPILTFCWFLMNKKIFRTKIWKKWQAYIAYGKEIIWLYGNEINWPIWHMEKEKTVTGPRCLSHDARTDTKPFLNQEYMWLNF